MKKPATSFAIPFALSMVFALALGAALPAAADAAWWNPLSWGTTIIIAPIATTSSAAASPVVSASSAPAAAAATSASSTAAVPLGISTSHVVPSPLDDLKNQVASLQSQLATVLSELADANAKIASQAAQLAKAAQAVQAAQSSATQTKVASQNQSALSDAQVKAKALPALVTLATATTTGTGAIIDSSGHIITFAHTIWAAAPDKSIVGVAGSVTVTMANGTQKTATVLGMDEASDVAVLQISGGGSYPYLNLNYGSAATIGAQAYVASAGSAASNFVDATVASVGNSSIQVTSDAKPADIGGALLDSRGNMIGIPNGSVCKIVEDITNCLKYTVTANLVQSVVPKLLAGMILYKNNINESPEEILIKGELQGIHDAVDQSTVIGSVVNGTTGANSFDYFNSKLVSDTNGRIARLYLQKLDNIADQIGQVMDFLKSQTYDLNVFFEDEEPSIAHLGAYERATIIKLKADNLAKLAEYEKQLDIWTNKKHTYDSFILNPNSVTHDFLEAEGVAEENAADYITAQQQYLKGEFSGEAVNIF